MSGTPVLRAEDVGKRYRIGATVPPPATPWHAVGRWFARPWRRAAAVMRGRLAEASEAELWAIRDLSFEVKEGEILGLVGANGAGKTTLLRLLAGITRPTTGRLGIRGRVGSMLEVGIGFHPDLTGRENVYFYGAMLGLPRDYVRSRFDRIVAFSGLERFIDTLLKFYSTGMYTRLAFAVAAELAPEVLLVDEVLSVSDFGFQQRGLATIERRAREGATVLFVSHNLRAMEALCTRCLLLEDGRLLDDGPPLPILEHYRERLASANGTGDEGLPEVTDRAGSGAARITGVTLAVEESASAPITEAGPNVRLGIRGQIHTPRDSLALGLAIQSPTGALIASIQQPLPDPGPLGPGPLAVEVLLPDLPLRPGEYHLVLWLGIPGQETCDRIDHGLPTLSIALPDRALTPAIDPLLPIGPIRIRSKITALDSDWPPEGS